MRISISILVFLCSTYAASLGAQANFRTGWEKANPIGLTSTLPLVEKVKTHQEILDQAILENDSLKRLYSFLYLFEDYLDAHDFSKAAEYLLEAESLAKDSRNPNWQGFVVFRRGVLNLRLKNYKQAIPYYETAATRCAAAGDSMCVGESLGQISAMYAQIGDYAQAHQYFNLALPLITRYGTNARLASLLDNFGNLLINQGRPAEAIPYFEKALLVIEKGDNQRQAAIFRNNLAFAHGRIHNYEQAVKIYRQCILLNQEKNWKENLIYNYDGIAEVFEQTGRYREALDFYKKYQNLQDSLIGINTQEEIANLEAQYQRKQEEMKLQKSVSELATARLSLQRSVLLLMVMSLLIVFGVWRWRLQALQTQRERLQNQENLDHLTRILLEKNKQLKELEDQFLQPPPKTEDFEEDIYNQRILTNEDWAAFKAYFNKVYPGYMLRLRTAYPTLSDAELRLFLFIKLNLNRKEAAVILGISPDSVKKTRSRLRHRLGLGEDIDLDAYILAF